MSGRERLTNWMRSLTTSMALCFTTEKGAVTMTDKKAERYDDLANRFGTEAAQRIVDAEFAEELDLENHEGIQQLKAWREDKNEQKRMEQQQREKERQQALAAQAREELRATKARM